MKKTLIGTLVMALAIMMTLSGAVFAAETLKVAPSASEVKEGETVTVTITHPATTTGVQYDVKYDAAVLSTDADKDHDGIFTAVGYTADGSEYLTHKITFKAVKAGTSAIELSNIKVSANNGVKIDTEATASTSVTVKAEEAVVTPTPTPTKTPDGDQNKDNLGDTKTGFDAMYVVYLAAAVLVAAGIVTVARRK